MDIKRFILLVPAVLLMGASQGSLTVQTSVPTAGQSIPQGASRVPMLTLTMKATCGSDAILEQIILTHSGLGGASDITRVYLTEDGKRISRAVSFSGREKEATVRLKSITVPSCKTRTFTVLADFEPTARTSAEHLLSIADASDITSSANVLLKESTVGRIRTTPASSGTINVEYLPLRGSVSYGNNRQVSRIRLEADSGGDHRITSITFTNDGKARGEDLQDLFLETASGKRMTEIIPSLTGDTARMVFDPPLIMENNESLTLVLKADIKASRRKTIRFAIEEPSDIVAEPILRRSRQIK